MTAPIQAIARQAADTWLRSQVPAGTEPSGGLYRIADGVADAVLLAVQARIRAEALEEAKACANDLVTVLQRREMWAEANGVALLAGNIDTIGRNEHRDGQDNGEG